MSQEDRNPMEDLAWVSELEGIGGYENSTPSALDKLMNDEVKDNIVPK